MGMPIVRQEVGLERKSSVRKTERTPGSRQIAEERLEIALSALLKRRGSETNFKMPAMYMESLSKGRLDLALRALMGGRALIPAQTFRRIRDEWNDEYYNWKAEDLSSLEVVYQWADGIYIKAGLEHEGAAMLVMVGILKTGERKLLACEPGYRESKTSWLAILNSLAKRGLRPARLIIADSSLGIWPALADTGYSGRKQYCWDHKTQSVLNLLPEHLQTEASRQIKEMLNANTRRAAKRWLNIFAYRYGRSCPEAVSSLTGDWDSLTAFYSFPAEHWLQIRNVKVADAPLISLALKADRPETLSINEYSGPITWKLLHLSENYYRRFNKYLLLLDVYSGVSFADGIACSEKGLISSYLPAGGAIAVHAAMIILLAFVLPPVLIAEKDMKGVISVNLYSEQVKGDNPEHIDTVFSEAPQVYLKDHERTNKKSEVTSQIITPKADLAPVTRTNPPEKVAPGKNAPHQNHKAAYKVSVKEVPELSAGAPALKRSTAGNSEIVSDIRIELKSAQNFPPGFSVSVSFKEFARSRRNEPLTEYENSNLKKVIPQFLSVGNDELVIAIEKASEGVYDFAIDCRECEARPVIIDMNMKLSNDRKRDTIYAKRKVRASDKMIILKILMPEGIRWDDVGYFDGNIESFESITRYNNNANLVWREFKR
jgi:putative transposase